MADNTITADLSKLIQRVTELEAKLGTLASSINNVANATDNATASTKKNLSWQEKTVKLQEKAAFLRTTEGKAYLKAQADLRKLTSAQREHSKAVSSGINVMGQFKGMLAQMFGAYAVIGGIKNTINTIKDFERQMARVKAITGATEEEFQKLSKAAISISARGSIFDPKTIAELQVELSKLGFTAAEIIASTKPIINLATATGEDLAKAAEISAATLRSFQLDASQMGDVIDVMAKSFTSSALDMSRWAEGAKYAAPVANSLGWTIRDLGSLMAVLANRTIYGSLAGTSLRNIMSELNNESSTLYKTLELTDNSFEGFIEALGRANEEGLGTTEMLEMIPRRALTAFTVLASSTKEVQRMRVALEDASGAVNEMAEIQLQTLASRLAITQNAWESLVVSIDEGSGVISRSIKGAADWVTELITRLNLINDYDLDLWQNLFGESFLPTFEEIRKIQKDVSKETGKVIQDILIQTRELEGQEKSLQRTNRFRQEIVKSIDEEAKLEERITEIKSKREAIDAKIAEWERSKDPNQSQERRSQILREIEALENQKKELDKSDPYRLIKLTERAKAYGEEVEDYFANLFSNLRKLDRDELERRANELDLILRKAYQRGDTESPLVVAQRRELEQIILILDGKTKATKDANDELTKEQEKLEKSLLQLEYQRRKNQIALNEELTDQQREEELASLKSWYQTELYQLEIKYEEELAIREAYQKLLAQQQAILNKELTDIDDEYLSDAVKKWEKYYKDKYDEEIANGKIEARGLEQQLKQKRKLITHSADEELQKQKDIAQLEYQIALDKNGNVLDATKRLKDNMEALLSTINDGKETPEIIALKQLIAELEEKIRLLEETRGDIVKQTDFKKPKNTIADLFDIDNRDFELIVRGINEVSSALTGMADAAVEAAERRSEAQRRLVEETQRDLEIELQLAEQGFASNVSLKRKELEIQKQARDQALKEEEEAKRKQLALQAALDAANLVSTVIYIALQSAKTSGLAGIVAGVVGAAGLFALVAKVRSQSKSIMADTKYEKGGWELLKGDSHKNGGISLGKGREAEGGEMLAVFNKRTTRKYGKDIGNFVDALNKDKIKLDMSSVKAASIGKPIINQPIVNINNDKLDDVHAVLKQIRDRQEYVYGSYKIVKDGNRIRKIRINGV